MSWFKPLRRIELARLNRVVVHTKDGHTLSGVLWREYADAVDLRSVSYIRDDATVLPVDGNILVLLENVSWIQELGAGDK